MKLLGDDEEQQFMYMKASNCKSKGVKNAHTKKILAVSTSFLFQITMNDKIIMSKQLFMIPERKARRLHNVQLFTD